MTNRSEMSRCKNFDKTFLPAKSPHLKKFTSLAQAFSFEPQAGIWDIYMFIITAAPPKRAATPTAPVFMGIAIPLMLELAPALDAPAPVAEAAALVTATDGVGMPLVNGTAEALLAPEKAGICVLAVILGMADGFFGLSTLESCQ
jgi:hypothetical protein